jgi:HprK-related kinase A
MKLAELPKNLIISHLKHGGLKLKIGAFNVCIYSPIDTVSEHLLVLYGDYDIVSDNDFIDFHTVVKSPSIIRRYFRPQVNFSFDGYFPFKPLPYTQASAMFEWGLNWCIANHSHQYLVIHAAVVERNGKAIIFPGNPGSGKSTLCAALVCNGWRLLSDELTLVSVVDGLVYPAPRPISLKNKSIEVIRALSPDAVIGSVVNNTAKGAIGHVRPPTESVKLASVPAMPAKLIFPKFRDGSKTILATLSKSRALLKLVENCFNYNILGVNGFNCVSDLVNDSDCFNFEYSSLNETLLLLTDLSD